MKIGVLTSSRADFGIYYPLLTKFRNDKSFEIEIIAFGTHLKKEYGYTIYEIKNLGFNVKHKIETPVTNNRDISIEKLSLKGKVLILDNRPTDRSFRATEHVHRVIQASPPMSLAFHNVDGSKGLR